MTYLFDTSSIFVLIEKNSSETLVDNVTVNLAFFELGNILWKEAHIHKHISTSEMQELQQYINTTLHLMQIISIKDIKQQVLTLAHNHDITFYDASYVYPAIKNEWPFVTEDTELQQKVQTTVNILTATQLLS